MATSFDMAWDDIRSDGESVGFLKLEAGKAGNRVRVVSKPSKIDVHWENTAEGKKKATCSGAKCLLCERGAKAQPRYQILVLDKTHWDSKNLYGSDGPKVKVLETGISVMKAIREFALNEEYGDPTKYDINIRKEGSGKETRYTVVPSPKKSDLTEEEKAAIENAPSLKDLNKIPTEEELIAMKFDILSDLNSDGDDSDADEFGSAPASTSNKTDDTDWDEFD